MEADSLDPRLAREGSGALGFQGSRVFLDICTSNNMDALKVALADPPVASKDKALKVSVLY